MFVDNFKKKGHPVTPFVISSVKYIYGTPGGIAEVDYQAVQVALSERVDLPMLGCRRFYLGDTLTPVVMNEQGLEMRVWDLSVILVSSMIS